MKSEETKNQAVVLRKSGIAIKEIAKQLAISHVTILKWLRDVVFTDDEIKLIQQATNKKHSETRKKQWDKGVYGNRVQIINGDKQCSKCKHWKKLSEFYAYKKKIDSWCRLCKNDQYKLTAEGRSHKAWHAIKDRLKKADIDNPRTACYVGIKLKMNRTEFTAWAVPEFQKFMIINPDKCPSVDRIDSTKHYEPTNLQIIDSKENTQKGFKKGLAKITANRLLGLHINNLLNEKISKSDFKKEISLIVKELCVKKGISPSQLLNPKFL